MEELITLETAQKAKEKNFNILVRSMYLEGKLYSDTNSKGNYNDVKWVRTWRNSSIDDTISAPTQSLLQKWLREVHNIHVTLFVETWGDLHFNYHVKVTFIKNKFWEYFIPTKDKNKLSIEQALEIGLQEGLKLIKDGSKNRGV